MPHINDVQWFFIVVQVRVYKLGTRIHKGGRCWEAGRLGVQMVFGGLGGLATTEEGLWHVVRRVPRMYQVV